MTLQGYIPTQTRVLLMTDADSFDTFYGADFYRHTLLTVRLYIPPYYRPWEFMGFTLHFYRLGNQTLDPDKDISRLLQIYVNQNYDVMKGENRKNNLLVAVIFFYSNADTPHPGCNVATLKRPPCFILNTVFREKILQSIFNGE